MNLGLEIGKMLSRLGYDATGSRLSLRLVRAPIKNRLFKNASLVRADQGYWRIEPLLDKNALAEYYRDEYWTVRTDQVETVNARDLSHYYQLRSSWPRSWSVAVRTPPLKLLNFGSGHGGLSHLLHADGWSVTNVEPGGDISSYAERWRSVDDLDDLEANEKFDLIYGSNVLEHVPDIAETIQQFKLHATEDTWLFFEVPDAESPGYGGSDGQIHAPHTYYFTTKFFETLFLETICLSSFCGNGKFLEPSDFRRFMVPPGKGDCIRALGRGLGPMPEENISNS